MDDNTGNHANYIAIHSNLYSYNLTLILARVLCQTNEAVELSM